MDSQAFDVDAIGIYPVHTQWTIVDGADRRESQKLTASGAAAPELVKELFDDGVKLLTGCKPHNARSLVGEDHGDVATQVAIKAARAEQITKPIASVPMRLAGKRRENRRDRRSAKSSKP